MLQIVSMRGDYQYQIAHLCISNYTKDTMDGIKHFMLKTADNKITDWWA